MTVTEEVFFQVGDVVKPKEGHRITFADGEYEVLQASRTGSYICLKDGPIDTDHGEHLGNDGAMGAGCWHNSIFELVRRKESTSSFRSYREFVETVWRQREGTLKEAGEAFAGLAEEVGEVQAIWKRAWRGDGKGDDHLLGDVLPMVVSNTKLRDELGDVLFYLDRVAKAAGYTLDEIVIANRAKLERRAREGKLKGDGSNR